MLETAQGATMTKGQRTAGDDASRIRLLAARADCMQNARALLTFANELDRRAALSLRSHEPESGMRDIYRSENGDDWFLTVDRNGEPAVLHRPNAASGGRESLLAIEAFLSRNPPGSPQRDALMRLVADCGPASKRP